MKKINWEKLEKEIGISGNTKTNVFSFIEKMAEQNSERVALHFEDEKGKVEEFSYSELITAVGRFANLLKKEGVEKGSRVALFLPKVPEMYIGTLAVIKLGAIAMPLFEAFQSEGLGLRLKRGDVQFMITNKELEKRLKGGSLKKKIKTFVVDSSDFRKSLKGQGEKCETVLVDKKDTCMMIFTSSTAGTPVAGIMLPHQGLVQWIYTGKEVLGLSSESQYWCTAHPAWVTGAVYGILSPLLLGSSVYVLEGRFDASSWLNFLRINKISNVYTAPTALRLLKADGKLKKSEFKLVKRMYSVGEALPESVFDFYKKLGVRIVDTYWQTETGAIVIANLDFKKGALGKAIGVNAVSREGMIMIEKGWPAMMTGIYKHDKMYGGYFEGKWFKTNDLATKKGDYFYFSGRKDDIIKTSGERVSPLEIEDILLKHPSVKESAVIGVPDKIRGSVIKAFIVLKEPFLLRKENPRKKKTRLENLKTEIGQFVKKNYAGHAYPKIVEFIDELPKGNSGKIIRMKLKEKS